MKFSSERPPLVGDKTDKHKHSNSARLSIRMPLALVVISPGGCKSEVNVVVFVRGKHNNKP